VGYERRRYLSMIVTVVFLLSIVLGGIPTALAQPSDVQGHWAEKKIAEWVAKGLAGGYPDGTFKPNNHITRAEFVALVNRAFEKQDPTATANFKDINNIQKRNTAQIELFVLSSHVSKY
jgi:hypothetical protein